MKKLLLCLTILVSVNTVNAAEILRGAVSRDGRVLTMEVRYNGCGQVRFGLKLRGCFESLPVQCVADLVTRVEDVTCEIYNPPRVITFNLVRLGWTGDYFRNASVTINGSRDAYGRPTSTQIRLK